MSKWKDLKSNADKLEYDPIDTKAELDAIDKMHHDPTNTSYELEALRNTIIGAPVRLPAQIADQEKNLGNDNTAFEVDTPEPEAPKI